jgi:sterol desaturase/sphingolipid hydroxylase (fatty acid hydroxylase superfamily)
MDDYIVQHEAGIRLGFFLGIFVLMALLEVLAPRRVLQRSKTSRWLNNLALVVLNTLLLRLLFPLATVGMAIAAAEAGSGLFNRVEASAWLAIAASVVLLDFAIWLQHVMVHAVPLFWRLHRVHHADPDFDVTTGARFHPLEIILSMLIKFGVILLLGPPVVAVIVFEIILNGMAMFNHSNVRLPTSLDRILRPVVVTPDMHRVHHSIEHDEANSNFGFNLSWWDRLFGTYAAQPRAGHEAMHIGIDSFDEPDKVTRLDGLLLLPFRGKVNAYAINRRQWARHDDDGDGRAL